MSKSERVHEKETPKCLCCGKPLKGVWDGTNFLFYARCCITNESKKEKFVPRGFENTRYSTDVCLVCHRIVRRDQKPDGACPNCGNKTKWKHEMFYSENDT